MITIKPRILLALTATACLFGGVAAAHHSFPATYLVDEEIKIEGELVAFMYRNPHAFVHLNVKEKGKTIRYAVEWGGAAALIRQGVNRDTFKAGDFVRVWGNPGRNPEDHRVRMRRIERPSDSYRWGFEGETFGKALSDPWCVMTLDEIPCSNLSAAANGLLAISQFIDFTPHT